MRYPFPRPRTALLIAAAATLLAACSPVKLLNSVVPSDTYALEGDVSYGPAPRQQLDVYRPLASTLPAEGKRPLVVFFYGGTWTTGERAGFRFVGEALAARGAVVVLPDYGRSPAFKYPVFVQDSALAVKWALDNAARLGADPSRVYVMGHSSGGYNTAMVALDARWLGAVGASPKQLAGWIGLAGPYDFLPIVNPDARVAFNWPATPPDSQPLAHASAASPRALLLVAREDKVVNPVRNTGQMAAKLQAAGVSVQTREFDDLGHITLIVAVAKPLRWLGGPVLPPVLAFLGLPPDAGK
ncbi:alpha/beta hydrolase [Variovorax sp. J22G21]|uniref:alpha/beta hydrolase n=1 Tax=Variovorax fucosicus TaxID=3053517 RepID=UPI0025787B35|nr:MULTISPECIES: alpha/beta hydrolase [unclassified Variovorax]MDM0039533.1 alpha/beta hydrolase [Variovorax sp. J22R193]MDM0064308.1 alpha/beta hydrolase [Variovorax sp. J22G21]